MKGLSWKQRQHVIKQRKVEKAAVNAAAGSVSPSPTASMSAAVAASAPRLRLMVPLPLYPARQATAPAYLTEFGPPVQPTLTGPFVQPWQHQLPALQMMTFGRPADPTYPRPDELLLDLSLPPCDSTYPQTRDYRIRQDAVGLQNVARNQAYPFSTSILGMQIPDEFNACYPPLGQKGYALRRKSPRHRYKGQVQ